MNKSIFVLLLSIFVGCSNLVSQAELCLKIGDYDNAILFFNEAIRKKPDSFRARHGLARAFIQRLSSEHATSKESSGDWLEAIRYLTIASRLNETDEIISETAFAFYKLAKLNDSEKDTIAALEAAVKAVALDSSKILYANYAGILSFRNHNHIEADKLFRHAALKDSTDPTSFFNLGMLAWYDQSYNDAFMFWKKATMIVPKDPMVTYWFKQAELQIQQSKVSNQ